MLSLSSHVPCAISELGVAVFIEIKVNLSLAYSFDVSISIGLFQKSGSPKCVALSAYANRCVSVNKCTNSVEFLFIDFKSKFSSVLSICITRAPPELGGPIEIIV